MLFSGISKVFSHFFHSAADKQSEIPCTSDPTSSYQHQHAPPSSHQHQPATFPTSIILSAPTRALPDPISANPRPSRPFPRASRPCSPKQPLPPSPTNPPCPSGSSVPLCLNGPQKAIPPRVLPAEKSIIIWEVKGFSLFLW